MKKYLMKCGHIAYGQNKEGKPICITCCATKNDKESKEIAKIYTDNDDLKGREAKCSYCKHIAESKWDLPFFQHNTDKPYDEYYCGCEGWD